MAAGDKLSLSKNHEWQIAATVGALANLLVKMNGVPDAYQATQSQEEWVTWLKLELMQPGSLNKCFFHQVYRNIISKIVDYNYGAARIADEYQSPQGAVGGQGVCTCDEDPTGANRDVVCYAWDFVDFVEQGAGTLANDIWTFSGLTQGYYVLAYASSDAFPTTFLTVTA